MFIGEKKIKEAKENGEFTPGQNPIMRVEYENGEVEHYSKLMYEQIVSDASCQLDALREKRVRYVVAATLALFREYGVRAGDTPYISVLLNQSLNDNLESATKMLWAEWMPKPLALDDVDFVTVDRVLKSKKQTLNDVLQKPADAGK